VGKLFISMDWKLVRNEGMMDGVKHKEIVEESLLQSFRHQRLRRRFTFQQDNEPKLTAEATLKWFKRGNLNVLEWTSQNLDLNPSDPEYET